MEGLIFNYLELQLGPNGGLIYCFEYFNDNFNWFNEQLDEGGYDEDDYLIIDCPGYQL